MWKYFNDEVIKYDLLSIMLNKFDRQKKHRFVILYT